MDKNLRAYVAEFVGTFAVVFLSAGAVCAHYLVMLQAGMPTRSGADWLILPWVGIALAAGLSYAVALALTVPLSGGCLNPAVTLALWVFRRLDGARASALIGVQLLAGVVAGMILRLVLPEDTVLAPTRVGTPHLNQAVLNLQDAGRIWTMAKGIGIEVVLTALVTFTLFALILDPKVARADRWAGRLGAFWVGVMVIAVTLAGHSLTGAGVNPARWFGTVVWEMTVPTLQGQGPLQDHMAYWLGPIMGALLAGWIYSSWIMPREEHPRAH